MDRAAIGLGSVFLHLDAEINWYKLFHSIIENHNIEDIRDLQKKELLKAGLTKKD